MINDVGNTTEFTVVLVTLADTLQKDFRPDKEGYY